MSRVYPFKDYGKHLCLKPPVELWLIILYFIRPFILKISTIQMGIGVKSRSIAGLKELVDPDDFGFFVAFIATIPALMVLFSFARRKPGGSDIMRMIWHRGAALLIVTAVLTAMIVFNPLVTGISQYINTLGWMQLAVAGLIVTYLISSQ